MRPAAACSGTGLQPVAAGALHRGRQLASARRARAAPRRQRPRRSRSPSTTASRSATTATPAITTSSSWTARSRRATACQMEYNPQRQQWSGTCTFDACRHLRVQVPAARLSAPRAGCAARSTVARRHADADGDGRPESAAGRDRHTDADSDATGHSAADRARGPARLGPARHARARPRRGQTARLAARGDAPTRPRTGRALEPDRGRRRRRHVLRAAEREGAAGAAQPWPPRRQGDGRADAAGRLEAHTQPARAPTGLASMGCAALSLCSRPVSACRVRRGAAAFERAPCPPEARRPERRPLRAHRTRRGAAAR